MRLGINATFLNDKPTGVCVFTHEVSTRLSGLNKETLVFSNYDIQGCSLKRTPSGINGSLRLSNNLRRFFYINTALPYLLERYRTEVLYCPMTEFPFLTRQRIVVTIHDLHPIYFPQQFGLSSIYFRTSLRLLRKRRERIAVPSNFVKTELLKYSGIDPERIDVVYNGYDPSKFRPQDKDNRNGFLSSYSIKQPYILMVGSMFPYKNVLTLIKAFKAIKDKIPHVIVIAGRRDIPHDPLPQDERILYIDYVNQTALPYLYAYAEMLVHPSLFEGFGMTILEAMACGTPVISSNGGSLPEVAGDAGLLFEPKDARKLSELILTLTNNENLRKKMIEKGFRNTERFSWDRTAEGILNSCEKTLIKK